MEFRAVKCTIYHKVILPNTVSTPYNQKEVKSQKEQRYLGRIVPHKINLEMG